MTSREYITVQSNVYVERGFLMLGLIWGIIVILLVVWLIGIIFHIAGGLINILLVIVLILVIWNLIQMARTKRK